MESAQIAPERSWRPGCSIREGKGWRSRRASLGIWRVWKSERMSSSVFPLPLFEKAQQRGQVGLSGGEAERINRFAIECATQQCGTVVGDLAESFAHIVITGVHFKQFTGLGV